MALTQIYTAVAGHTITAARWNNEFGNIYNNGTDLAFPLTKAVTLGGFTVTYDSAGVSTVTSPANAGYLFTVGNKSGAPSASGSLGSFTASTFTDTSTAASGTATLWTGLSIRTPTLAATNLSVTTTDAATLYIEGPPTAGTNETITNPWALYVNGKTKLTDNLALGGVLTVTGKSVWLAEGASIASHASGTTELWTTDGNTVHITGTNTISSFGTAPQAGAYKTVIFDGALLFTYSASLLLPGGVDITTAPGDVAVVYAETTTTFDVQHYTRASGAPVVSPGASLVFITALNLASDNVFNDLGSLYDEHLFQFIDVVPGTDNQNLRLTFSRDNGSSFLAATYDYRNNTVLTSGNTHIILFLNAGSSATAGGISGTLHLYKPHGTARHKRCMFDLTGGSNGNIITEMRGCGWHADTPAINAIKIAFDTGTTNGVVRHYGVKTSI